MIKKQNNKRIVLVGTVLVFVVLTALFGLNLFKSKEAQTGSFLNGGKQKLIINFSSETGGYCSHHTLNTKEEICIDESDFEKILEQHQDWNQTANEMSDNSSSKQEPAITLEATIHIETQKHRASTNPPQESEVEVIRIDSITSAILGIYTSD